MYLKTVESLVNIRNGYFLIQENELRFYAGEGYLIYKASDPGKLLNMITESLLLGNILLDLTDIDLEDL